MRNTALPWAMMGLYRDNGKDDGNYRGYRGNIGVIVGLDYWGYVGIMEKKNEATIQGLSCSYSDF